MEEPHWERGFRCHGYWLGTERLGVVGLPCRPSVVTIDGYEWQLEPWDKSSHAATLKEAKLAVELAWKASIRDSLTVKGL